jgi:hypothetical protein
MSKQQTDPEVRRIRPLQNFQKWSKFYQAFYEFPKSVKMLQNLKPLANSRNNSPLIT